MSISAGDTLSPMGFASTGSGATFQGGRDLGSRHAQRQAGGRHAHAVRVC